MLTTEPRRFAAQLAPLAGFLEHMGERFALAGHRIALVGGPVRDAFLGRLASAPDLDFTTDARPEQTVAVLSGWAEHTWDQGIRFGTVGARIEGQDCEITTYRSEHYDAESRKPEVNFGDSLLGDLGRRDFTVNAMALELPTLTLVDAFNGVSDVRERIIRTPGSPEASFGDDPLRMLRAARFAAQLGFEVDPTTFESPRQFPNQVMRAHLARVNRDRPSTSPAQGLVDFIKPGR